MTEALSAPSTRFLRAGTLAPSSFDASERTVELVWTTGSPVIRHDPNTGEQFTERLSLEPGAIRLDRLNNGAAVLDAHEAARLSDQIGVVVPGSARVENGRGVARIQLSARPEVAGLVADISAGIIRNISVGYQVHAWQRQEAAPGARPVRLAVDWEPFELSFVPIPADPSTQTRKNNQMIEAPVYVRDIRAAATRLGLGVDVVLGLIERHEAAPFTPTELKRTVEVAWAADDAPARTNSRHGGDALGGDGRERNERMADALFARMTGRPPSEGAREFMGSSLLDLARASLNDPRAHRLNTHDLIDRSLHTTSDFPVIAASAARRVFEDVYDSARGRLKEAARRRTVSDFRPFSMAKLTDASALERVSEHGEYRYGTVGESAESGQLATFGRIVGLTRQVIVNDDLGAFADMVRLLARAAAETEASEFARIFNQNAGAGPTMRDGLPLFHGSRNNLAATGSAISVTSLGAVRAAMRLNADTLSGAPLNLTPRFLITGAANETLAEQTLTQLNPETVANANPFAGKLELLVDPRLTGNAWWLAADPGQWPSLEYFYLDGAQGPQFFQREGFNMDGIEFKVTLDFWAGISDPRGLFRNPGA